MRMSAICVLAVCLAMCSCEKSFNSRISTSYLDDSMSYDNNDSEFQDNHNHQLGRGYRQCIDPGKGGCYYDDFYKCNFTDLRCHHKDVIPVKNIELLGYLALFIQLVFSNAAGIGGGYFSMIIFYEVFRFEWLKALSLCSFINLLASLVRFVFFFRTKHPIKPHHTLIDYELVVLYLPLSILGILLGHLIYRILPMFAIGVLIAIFWAGIAFEMAHLAYTSIKKIRQLDKVTLKKKPKNEKYERIVGDNDSKIIDDRTTDYKRINLSRTDKGAQRYTSLNSDCEEDLRQADEIRKTTQKKKSSELSHSFSFDAGRPVMNPVTFTKMGLMDSDDSDGMMNEDIMRQLRGTMNGVFNNRYSTRAQSSSDIAKVKDYIVKKIDQRKEKMGKELRLITKIESSHFGHKFWIVIASVILMTGDVLLRGESQNSIVGIKQCHYWDWISFLLLGTASFAIALYSLQYLKSIYMRKRKAGYRFELQDFHWDYASAFRMQIIAVTCGFIAGVLGMGEGAIFTVLFIELNRHPRVACATGMYINIVVSGGFAAVYAIEGYFDDYYYLSFAIVALLACLLGMAIESKIYSRFYKWCVPIILILITLNCIFASITIPHAALNRIFKNDGSKHDMWTFGQFCSPNSTAAKLFFDEY